MPLENVILTTDNCRYCLMCRHVAPIEQITHKETHSPHGWALIIASVRRGLLEWNPETVDIIYTAPDHGNSRAACVFDQPLPEAIAAVRAEIVQMGLAPEVVYKVNQLIEDYGSPFASQPPKPTNATGEIALFVGDETFYLWPHALEAALKLLKVIGVKPVLIGNGRNNGYFSSSLGFPETARKLALENLAELRSTGAQRMLVLSPGDYFTFKQLYDERLGIPWPEEIELIETVQFLSEQLDNQKINFRHLADGIPWAYVDPTHAVRLPNRHDQPRKLLKAALPNQPVELFWRRERAHPVGSTALQFTQPSLAAKLTQARLNDAKSTGAQVIFTEDPGTLHKLSQFSSQYDLQVMGLYEFLADSLE